MTHTNRLIHSSSPYLLQHAHNPVDWYPWGDEALKRAKKEDKPIILSIGYSACHWCHVMERESFEHDTVAKVMNEHFICIKVDREERPDIDQVYMDALHAMGLQGGWPLNVILTPNQKPFYGGTYFPQQGWLQLLQRIAEVFQTKRKDIENSADGFMKTLTTSEVVKYQLTSDPSLHQPQKLTALYEKLEKHFDQEKGGMDRAPKFPMPAIYHFLLREHGINNNEGALSHVINTLDHMAMGGIYDQIGGGFARYSTDTDWFAPHFEKMLYDNGQLVSLYSEAYALTKSKLYKQVVYQTIDWLEREMTSPESGFYAALDADSEGEEGKFYTWTTEGFKEVLGVDAGLLTAYYNMDENGNWEGGKNIPFRSMSDTAFAKQHELTVDELEDLVKSAQIKLLDRRETRTRPGLDDKILAGWNGLMLKGLVDAYAAFAEPKFLDMAKRNASFLQKYMKKGGQLYRNFKNGKATLAGYLEDYAAVIQAFIALYQVTFEETWLTEAHELTLYTIENFYDPEERFFYFTDSSSEALIARKKEIFDNVIPASNSIMATNLYFMGIWMENNTYHKMAEDMVNQVKKMMETEPQYLTNWACLFSYFAKPTVEIAIVGSEVHDIARQVAQNFIPNKILVGALEEGQSDLPLLKERKVTDNKTTIYICYNKACQLPVHTVEEALKQIK